MRSAGRIEETNQFPFAHQGEFALRGLQKIRKHFFKCFVILGYCIPFVCSHSDAPCMDEIRPRPMFANMLSLVSESCHAAILTNAAKRVLRRAEHPRIDSGSLA